MFKKILLYLALGGLCSLMVGIPVARANLGGAFDTSTNLNPLIATITFTPNGQQLFSSTSGELTTTSRIRADGGFRVGGILIDLNSSGISFSSSAVATIDATSSNSTPVTLKGKSGNAANVASIAFNTAATNLANILGVGALQFTPGTALAISGAPDVTRTPTTTSTACRFAAASAGQTWTPAETNVVDGEQFCCTNTGANSVTMAESAGVYEGTAAVVGQWDVICMEYVTDRWVQTSFMDN